MKTNRKTRPQPSLAPLSAEEYHQLADMVRTRTYDDILQQISKPRAEGGFDLDISIKPLQVLHRRVTELDRVNKLIADGQKLTLTAYDELQAGQTPPTEQIHNAILNATWLQVQYSENTPHQLLALQRLADFPARAEIRENREQIYQEKHAHRIEMDTFRKEHSIERLEIQKRHLQIAEKRAEKEFSTQNSTLARGGDHLGPFARNWDDVSERARIHFGVSKEEWARRTGADEEQTQVEDINSQNSPDTTPLNTDHSSPSALSAPSAVNPELSTLNPQLSTEVPSALIPSQTLEERVDHYTTLRAQEYLAYEQKRSEHPANDPNPFPPYITQYRYCPCGNDCPCPIHEDEEIFGSYYSYFWTLSPFHSAYAQTLRERNMQYRNPANSLHEIDQPKFTPPIPKLAIAMAVRLHLGALHDTVAYEDCRFDSDARRIRDDRAGARES